MTTKIVIIPMALLLIVAMVGDVNMAGAVVVGFLGGMAVGFILFRR